MKQCFGYVRVSTHKQGEGVSLVAQRDAIVAFAEKHGLRVTRWFEEQETAAKTGRPVFTRMMRELHAGHASGVILHRVDRGSRNLADWAKIGELSDAGVDVYFVTESLDFRSRGGRLTADIQAVIAADYIRNLREETQKGIRGRLKQGLYPFAAPIGYQNNGGGQVKTIDPITGPLVRDLFSRYLSGTYSIRSLTVAMKARGLRNRNGRPVTKTGIETILSNPFYAGLIHINRTGMTYEGIHERLISMADYERIQAIKSGRYRPKVTRHDHRYRGLFRCRGCRTIMIPERQKGHVYYRCHTKNCPTKTIREEVVEEAVATLLRRVRLHPHHIRIATERFAVWARERFAASTGALELQLAQIKDRLERLTDALIDRLIDQETFTARQQPLLAEKIAAEERLVAEQNRPHHPGHLARFLERIKSLADTYEMANAAEKRQLVELTTSNRTVFGKTVYLEPANWLLAAEEAVAVLCGAPERDTARTNDDCDEKEFRALMHAVNEYDQSTQQLPSTSLASLLRRDEGNNRL